MFTIEILITICNTWLLCHLSVWGSTTESVFTTTLHTLSGSAYEPHSVTLFKRLQFLKINDIYVMRVYVMMTNDYDDYVMMTKYIGLHTSMY